ncbi:MAG: DNA mismatch repair protein MutS [Eubacteriales bacterium]|nr:DNA mismatch repair protein MutS [Eubacteriales bacterium]
MAKEALSPMMTSYLQTKEEYPDCILFYRLGDFYEMFFDDAVTASRELELTLTGKSCGLAERAPMCGVPHHSAEVYIEKLVAKGYKVAVCEQVEDPKEAKGLVKRAVVRVITAGTLVDENMLDERANNYLSVCFYDDVFGFVFCDISTGEIFSTEAKDEADAISELARYMPREVIMNDGAMARLGESLRGRLSCDLGQKDKSYFLDTQIVKEHFGVESVAMLSEAMLSAVTGLLNYLEDTQKNKLEFINHINVYTINEYMEIDPQSRRSLEICETMRDKSKRGSLLGALDMTKTSMGARRFRQWLEKPLMNPIEINRRLFGVDELYKNAMLREEIAHALDGIYDISRILTRVLLGSVSPRDMASLRESLKRLPEIKYLLSDTKTDILSGLYARLDIMEDICTLLTSALEENPSISVKDGEVIKKGFSDELDELRDICENTDKHIRSREEYERERTGIKTLKISYNKVFGYYIEVTKLNSESVPEDYIRKQTLVNSERYITPQLKELEEKILSASEQQFSLETEIFAMLRREAANASERLKVVCEVISDLDALCSMAMVAAKNSYVMPEICQSGEIVIKDGRHPVVERIQRQSVFVPNDTTLDNNDNRLLIITGPNMAGKSTYMRQTALITLMAQVGSFVPASYAKISITDRIFTRVGASDDIAQGQSTFMLEMSEVSHILANATKNSLIILDEIGRGTSTFDGLSIAWAVSEYVANKRKIGAKTLFATHYHELCALEGMVDGVKNYSIAVKKRGDDITFLRKIVRGGTDDSFGIEVAALAGVPNEVVKRAKEILKNIEKGEGERPEVNISQPAEESQFGFGEMAALEIARELANLDATVYTPIEAMNKLYELSQKAKELM